MQCLAQTHFLTQLLDVQCQSGQRVYLPGQAKSSLDDPKKSQITENGRIQQKKKEKIPLNENEEDVELVCMVLCFMTAIVIFFHLMVEFWFYLKLTLSVN